MGDREALTVTGGAMVFSSDYTALVALRAKSGECEAVRNAPPELWRRVQPMIDLDDHAAATQLEKVETMARRLAPVGRHLMVDVSEVRVPSNFGPAGPLGAVVDRLAFPVNLLDEDSPVPIIPVVRGDASATVATSVRRLADETGIGVALRIVAQETDASAVARLLELLEVDRGNVDVIVDGRYVDAVRPELTAALLALVDSVTAIGPVRSVAVLSGSVPRTLNRTSLWEQPRYEELLWHEVSSRRGRVRIGDYGAVHPVPGAGFRSNHVSIKYSCATGWLFSREHIEEALDPDGATESGRSRTFRSASRRLVDDEHFAGPHFSWGDGLLATAASGGGSGLGATSNQSPSPLPTILRTWLSTLLRRRPPHSASSSRPDGS